MAVGAVVEDVSGLDAKFLLSPCIDFFCRLSREISIHIDESGSFTAIGEKNDPDILAVKDAIGSFWKGCRIGSYVNL